jgi:hypothetical protein
MLIKNSDLCRESIRKTLVQYSGESPDAGAIAEAVLITWHEMAAQFNALIGEKGVDALFRRSLHLTRTSLSRPAIPENDMDKASLLAILKADLSVRETADAFEAGLSLLATFIELLSTLIGGSLTERLLIMALAPPSPAINKENNHERQNSHRPTRHRRPGTGRNSGRRSA